MAALLVLTGVTGLVDAVSYLRLGRTFVANMTGNVVFIGFGLHPHSGLSPAASLVALGGFLFGAVAGGRYATHLSHHAARWTGISLGTEAAVLVLVAVLTSTGALGLDGGDRFATVALLAVALGLQNATIRHLGVPDLTTTVLTLTLTGLAADGAIAGGAGARPHRRLGSVAAMLAGAGTGAVLLDTSASAVIAVAAALVAGVAVTFAAVPALRPPADGTPGTPGAAGGSAAAGA